MACLLCFVTIESIFCRSRFMMLTNCQSFKYLRRTVCFIFTLNFKTIFIKMDLLSSDGIKQPHFVNAINLTVPYSKRLFIFHIFILYCFDYLNIKSQMLFCGSVKISSLMLKNCLIFANTLNLLIKAKPTFLMIHYLANTSV